jgi:uncharacterized protein
MDFKRFSLMVAETKTDLFVESLAQGKIMATRCKACKREYYPPQADCPHCFSQDMEWFECPTEGKLVAFTQIMVLPEHFALPTPEIPFGKASLIPSPVGLVKVQEGICVMGWIPKVSVEELEVGEPMRVRPHMLDDGRITIVLEKLP